jgi:hypothetical protein
MTPILPSPCYLVGPDGVVVEQAPRRPSHEVMPRTLLRLIFDGPYDTPEASERLAALIPPLARCVFGNPFRPVPVDPACVTPTVRTLARTAYDEAACELDTGRLAVLVDAMEKAGGASELVQHLREPGLHVCGCWAVDACLGLG